MTTRRRLMILLLLALSLSGCASFRGGRLAPIAAWPPEPIPSKKSIGILVTGTAEFNGRRQTVPSETLALWHREILKAYTESGLFSTVGIGAENTDLRAHVSVLNRAEGSVALAILSGLTLGLIPAQALDEFIITTVIRDRGNQELGTFEKSETVSTWFQLFLIFAMPTNSPDAVGARAFFDVHRAILGEARAKGVF